MEFAVSNVNQIARVLQLTIGGKIIYGSTLHILNITILGRACCTNCRGPNVKFDKLVEMIERV